MLDYRLGDRIARLAVPAGKPLPRTCVRGAILQACNLRRNERPHGCEPCESGGSRHVRNKIRSSGERSAIEWRFQQTKLSFYRLALQAAALKVLKKIMKYAASQRRHRWASGIFGGDERDRPCCRAARGRRPAQHPAENSHQLFRRREQAMQRFRRSRRAEVRLSSCPGAQPIQSGSPSRDEGPPQLKTLGCLGRVSRSRGINRRSRDGDRAACRQAYGTLTTPRVPSERA